MKKSFFVIFLMIFFVLFGCTKDQTVKVSFQTNGGTAIADITELDDLLSGIPQTTKEGYTFAGWYEDQNFTTSFDPLEERESWEITLYAKWTANSTSYKVEYYQETLEGTYELIEDEDLNGVTGESVTATPKTYEGFTLNETHPNAVPSTSLPATGQATLKLYYDRNTYHVIIDEAGGTSVDDLDIMYGETITLPTLSRFGYTFVNWSSYPDTMPAHDINVTASWVELPKFDVTFDAHQGTTVVAQSIYQGYLATEPTDPVRVGYAFAGWYLDLEGTEYSFQTPITADIELHAKWVPILVDYNVQYYIEELNGTYTLDHTTTQQALTETVLTATPEVISGFSEHTSHALRVATGTVLGDGSLVLKLYYTRNTYTITFESNASLSIQSISALYEAAITKPQDPVLSGYQFMGWYTDQALTTSYTFNTMPAGGMTLYAKWQGEPTNLYFNSNGGTTVSSITAPLGDAITEPSQPTKEGYTFEGWYLNAGLTEAFTTWIMPAGGKTLYAKWTLMSYTISFEENGGTLVNDITQPYLSVVTSPTSPTKIDYIFVGWYTDIELQHAYQFTTMPLGGVTLYAKWISEEEGLTLSHMMTLDNYTAVQVKGEILVSSSNPYRGFYIIDDTGYLYVYADQDLVVTGNSYQFDAVLVYQQGIPCLVAVDNLVEITQEFTGVTPLVKTVDDIKSLTSSERYLVDVTGILLEDHQGYVLASPVNGEHIRMTNQFPLQNPTEFIQDSVHIYGILHQYDQEWIIAVYSMTGLVLTDQQKADMITDYIDQYYEDTYQSMDTFGLMTEDPWGFGSISMTIDSSDDIYYDDTNQQLLHVTVIEPIHFSITITINAQTFTHELSFNLVPRETNSVSSVLGSTIGDIYQLQGIVVMANQEEDIYILKDSTGVIFILGDLNVYYGDEITVEVKTKQMSDMIYAEYDEAYYMDVLSVNHELQNPPTVKSLNDLQTMSKTDTSQYGQYIELRGFIKAPMGEDMHEDFMLTSDTYQLPIVPMTYQAYEVLFEYNDLEALVRGYLALQEDGSYMLVFTGQRLEIKLPTYTDDERVEMISTVFSNMYADQTFNSYETFVLWPYHPVLGGNITWEFVEGGSYYDEDYQWFTYTDQDVSIKLEITISYGLASRTYIYQTTLHATQALTIEQFKQIGQYNYGFVEGVVVYRHRDRVYIQDETGILFVDLYEVDVYRGDRVILYGQLYADYQYPEAKYLYYYKSYSDVDRIPLVVKIIERDLEANLNVTPIEISEANALDPMDNVSYSKYMQMDGYLTFDGWYFTLTKGFDNITFEAIDEYTMYKLSSWQNQHVSIKLMTENYTGSEFDFVYLGIEGDISGYTYSLGDQQGIVADMVDGIWLEPIVSNSSRSLPGAYQPFGATMTYSVPAAYSSTFDLLFGYIYPVIEPLIIPLTVTITINDVSIDHVINVHVLPEDETLDLSISDAKGMIGQPIKLEASIYATFSFDFNRYGLLLHDETGFVIVNLENLVYFYGGNEIGKTAVIDGVMTYQNGRYIFNATSFATIDYVAAPTLVPEVMPIETLATLDHAFDDHLGEYIEVSGTIERVGWDHYEIVKGTNRIRIQTVYYGESTLSEYVGFDVKLKGFILGRSTYQGYDDITLVVGHDSYGGGLYVVMDEHQDQVIAEKLVSYAMDNRYDPTYFEGDRVYLITSHSLFPTAQFSYESISHPLLFENLGYELLVKHANVDTIATMRLTVTYGTATVTRDFELEVDGYMLNTLDDLFDESVPFDDITLHATLITSKQNYAYFLIDGDVYYYDGYLNVYGSRGDVVILHGKKAIVDGIINYTYHVDYSEMQTSNDVLLVPRSFSISDLYTTDLSVDDIRRDYITVYGKLGYDVYLNYFYLDDEGKRIYIRHDIRDAEYFSSTLRSDPTINLEVIMEYLNDYVYINVLFPNEIVLGNYILVDFVGTENDIWIPEHTVQERLQITKDKVVDKYDGASYQSGEYIDFMTMDSVQWTLITYELVNPTQRGLLLDSSDSLALIVHEATPVEIIATVTYYDEMEEVTYEDTATFTITILPIELSTVREVLYGVVGEYYQTKGVIQYLYEDYYMIIKDSTGLLYVEMPSDTSSYISLAVGDEVEVLGERGTFEMQDFVPIMDYAIDIQVISTGNAVNRTATAVTIDDILAIDYLSPDAYNLYVSFTGTVIFSGNIWYPSYDLREDGYINNTYDLQIWGNTYDPFNDLMDPLVGQVIEVEGYLVGFEYIYGAFDWQVKVTTHEVIIP